MKNKRMVMVGVLVATATVLPAGVAQAAEGDNWREIRPYPTLMYRELNDVEVAGGTDVWIAGSQHAKDPVARFPILQRWNGRSWSSSSPTDIGFEGRLYDLSAVTADDVWVVGNQEPDDDGTAATYLAHFDGSAWTRVAAPVVERIPENPRLVAADAGGVWLVEPGDRLFRYDGVSWTAGPDLDEKIVAVKSYRPDRAWVRTRSGLLHWDGTAWTPVALPAGSNTEHVHFAGPDEAWTVGYEGLLTWDGASWTQIPFPADYAGTYVHGSSDDGWIRMQGGAKDGWLKWTGSAWTEAAGGDVPDGEVVTDPEGRTWGVKTVYTLSKTTGRVVAFRDGRWRTLSPFLPFATFDLVSLGSGRIVGVGMDGQYGDLKGITNS